MPHSDNTGSRKGHESEGQKSPLEKLSFGARSRGSMLMPTQAQSAHISQSIHKQPLQLRPHRPTVLRRGHQPLPQECSEALHKVNINQRTPEWPDSSCQNKSPITSLKETDNRQGSPERGLSSVSEVASETALSVRDMCLWPNCRQKLEEPSYILRHLCPEHGPGEKTLGEYRNQRERVQYIEKQLALEKRKLQEMQFHLRLSDHGDTAETETVAERNPSHLLRIPQFMLPNGGLQGAMVTPSDLLNPSYLSIPSQFIPGLITSIDCYKNNNIRPPYTYAAMIRWAILESQEKQLALNEIYQWFMTMFHYFRHNTATWKNAVRHNLSLHKCFVRVEGVKGSVWTVDDAEFMRRKGQRIQRSQDSWMPLFYPQ